MIAVESMIGMFIQFLLFNMLVAALTLDLHAPIATMAFVLV